MSIVTKQYKLSNLNEIRQEEVNDWLTCTNNVTTDMIQAAIELAQYSKKHGIVKRRIE